MFDTRLHTPVGVKDILPFEAKRKRSIQRKMEDLFSGYGYEAVETPIFEYVEVFSDGVVSMLANAM